MRRIAGIVALVLMACSSSSGGGPAASTTTAAPSTTSTTTAPATTTAPEDAVKTAYLAYWRMADRLIAAPDPTDPELEQRAVDPLLASFKDELRTRVAQGRTTHIPPMTRYAHVVGVIEVDNSSATVSDCFIDDRVQTASDGSVINDRVSTVSAAATLQLINEDWKIADLTTTRQGDGSVGCDA